MKRHYYFKERFLGIIGILIFFAVTAYGAEESITLTTYYPSPYGVYSEMQLYPKGSPSSSSCQEGLMFYSNGSGSYPRGLHVCGSGGWQLIGGWSLLGNSGTNPATNFIGTIDAQDFVVKTNNAERMRVSSSGNVGIGTNNPGTFRLRVNGDMRVDGNVSWSGNLTSGSVPWARLTDFPTACPSGQYVRGVGGTLTCDSAIRRINGMSGPNISIAAGSNITISNAGNAVTISSSGGGVGGGGITSINSQTGPAVTLSAGSGISIATIASNNIQITNTGGGGGYWAPSGSNIYNTNAANVGVGTTNPSQKLEVAGNIKSGRFNIVDTMYGGGPYSPAVGTDGTNTGVSYGPGGNFYVLNSAGSYGNTYGNDYWVQAANGGAGKWASQLGGGGGGGGGPTSGQRFSIYNSGGGKTLTQSLGTWSFCMIVEHMIKESGGSTNDSCRVDGSLNGGWTLVSYVGNSQDGQCSAFCVKW